MKKITTQINRILPDGYKEYLGEFGFLDGDYFNLYYNLINDSSMIESAFTAWLGWEVKTEGDFMVIKKLLPPEEDDFKVEIGKICTFDFNGLGKYEIQIISIN